MTYKYQDGEFEDLLWHILVKKVLVHDDINITDDERAKDWADRFIKNLMEPLEKGTIPSPNKKYLENLGYETPYGVLGDLIPYYQIEEYSELLQNTIRIVNERYEDRNEIPEFHIYYTLDDSWKAYVGENKQEFTEAVDADEYLQKFTETGNRRGITKVVCSECGFVKEIETFGHDEELDISDYLPTFGPTEDIWECEKCGANNNLLNHEVLSDNFSFTEPIHHEKLEKVFATTNLVEKDFTGQDLSNVDFRKKDCRGAIFIGADLTGADFRGAKLRQADFEGANIRKADFSNAMLDGAVFLNANLFRVNFSYASLVGADFTFAQMTQLNFEGGDLRNATINEAFLTNVYFGGANLLNADLFRLDDYNLTDEEFEDFKRRGARI
jgi:uncharacterized protein YjbI with pentapeptide repeats